MKAYKIETAIVVLAIVLFIALGCVFVTHPHGFSDLSVNVKVVTPLKVVNNDGYFSLVGKIRNFSRHEIDIKGLVVYCEGTNFESDEIELDLERSGVILQAGGTYDFSSAGLQFSAPETNTYKVTKIEAKSMDGHTSVLYKSRWPILNILLVVVCFLFALLLVLPAIVMLGFIKKRGERLKASKESRAENPKSIYLLGALCQKGKGSSARTVSTTIRGAFRAIKSGVRVYTKYEEAVILNMFLTDKGLYIGDCNKDHYFIADMKFISKENFERVKITGDKYNVIMDFYNGKYIAFDIRSTGISKEKLVARLKALFYNKNK